MSGSGDPRSGAAAIGRTDLRRQTGIGARGGRWRLTLGLGLVAVLGLLLVGAWSAAGVQATPPANCWEVWAANPTATDGQHTIAVGGRALSVYCHGMRTNSPTEYLTLLATGSTNNFSQYTAGGASPGTSVRTTYTKLRFDPKTLAVNPDDRTFSTSTGQLRHSGGELVTSMPFGVAMACVGNSNAAGAANINLTGLPLRVADTFTLGGYTPAGTPTGAVTNQVVNLKGGGFCGWNAPQAGVTCPYCDIPGSFPLQLQFVPVADTTPPVVSVTGVSEGHYLFKSDLGLLGCKTTDAQSGVAIHARVTYHFGSLVPYEYETYYAWAVCSGAVDGAGNAQAAPVSVAFFLLNH